MQLFIDTANLDEIKEVASWGIIAGVTTNPSLVAKENRPFKDGILEICEIIKGPVSVEAVSPDAEGMLKEGREFANWAPNVVVKLPLTEEGIKACRQLSNEGIKTNVTLVFSANQALLAALAGATYVSPFIGRLDDAAHEGMDLIDEIRDIYDNYDFNTQILTASVRHPRHIAMAARMGSDVATIPYKVMKMMFKHPLTDVGIQKFMADWEKSQK